MSNAPENVHVDETVKELINEAAVDSSTLEKLVHDMQDLLHLEGIKWT